MARIGLSITRIGNITSKRRRAPQHGQFTTKKRELLSTRRHRLGKKVAAHAIGSDGIAAALRAGVDTIEHGDGLTEPEMDEMVKRGIYWVPTIVVGDVRCAGRGGNWTKMVDLEKAAFQKPPRRA